MLKEKDNRSTQAQEEIGQTEISSAQKWFLSLFFISIIVIVPLTDLFRIKVNLSGEDLTEKISALEKSFENSSLLKSELQDGAQKFMSNYLKTGS